MDDDYENYDADQLREHIRDLEEHLSEITRTYEDEIRQLKARKSLPSKGDDNAQTRLDALQQTLNEERTNTTNFKKQIEDLKAKLKVCQSERDQYLSDLRRKDEIIDELEVRLKEADEIAKSQGRKTEVLSKQKDKTSLEQSQLFRDNDILRAENNTLTKRLAALNSERIEFEEVIAKLADERESLELQNESFTVSKDEMQRRIQELEQVLEQTQDKLQVALEAEGEWEGHIERLQMENTRELERISKIALDSRKEAEELKRQMIELRDDTLVGSKQKEIQVLQQELKLLQERMSEQRQSLDVTLRDRKQLAEQLIVREDRIDELLSDRIAEEKEQRILLEKKVESLQKRVVEETDRVREGERLRAELVRKIEDLEQTQAVYESGEGLQEMARSQKKIKEDYRRQGIALEQLSQRYEEVKNMNELLLQAFDKLRLETGRGASFSYPESILKEELLGEKAMLRSQAIQLEEQVSALEDEGRKLRLALKNQAGMVGQDGFKFAGLTPDMIVKVNEYAASLRDGEQFQVDNRSSFLIAENRKLREAYKELQLQCDRLERELAAAATGFSRIQMVEQSRNAGPTPVTTTIIQQPPMRDPIQDEMMVLIRRLNSGVDEQREGISRALESGLEVLFQEIQSLKQTSGGNISSAQLPNNLGIAGGMGPNITLTIPSSDGGDSDHDGDEQPGGTGPPVRMSKLSKGSSLLPPTGRRDSSRSGAPTDGRETPFRYPGTAGRPTGGGPTPMKGRASFSDYGGGTPYGQSSYASPRPLGTPYSQPGKQLLNKSIAQMNLPPEDWADEVKDLNAQLVECLEQLVNRESELESQKSIIEGLEDALVTSQQQLAALYFDYSLKSDEWEAREKQFKNENENLLHERDDLHLRVKRAQEALDVLQRAENELETTGSSPSAERAVRELTRKLVALEVNEAILTRRYRAQVETTETERERRQRVESDLIEAESVLKRRILFLEQYKAEMNERVTKVQTDLNMSVPKEDYDDIQRELLSLREDLLAALEREVEARKDALSMHEQTREIRTLKANIIYLQSELHGATIQSQNLSMNLEHQKEATRRALLANKSTAEVSSLVSEMAKFRGEASRLEVEAAAAKKRTELLEENSREMQHNLDRLEARCKECEAIAEESLAKEQATRTAMLALQQRMEGGLEREQAKALVESKEKAQMDLRLALADIERYKEVAEISSQQAQSLGAVRQEKEEELKELREYCTKLESRNDDDVLIGRLQRQLMSIRTAYRTFVRKYQLLRSNLRQRELALRVLDKRLDQREISILDMEENYRKEILALKKALYNVSNIVDEDGSSDHDVDSKGVIKRGKKSIITTVPHRLKSLTQRVLTLSDLASNSVKRATEAEDKARDLLHKYEDSKLNAELWEQRCSDLNAVLTMDEGKTVISRTKQHSLIASRLVTLSEEIRELKLSNLQNRRQIQTLRQEKRHLQELINTIEADIHGLEESQVTAEMKNLLGDYRRQQEGLVGRTDVIRFEDILEERTQVTSTTMSISRKQQVQPGDDGLDARNQSREELELQLSQTPAADRTTKQALQTLTMEELIGKNENLAKQLAEINNENEYLKSQLEKSNRKLVATQEELEDRDTQIRSLRETFDREDPRTPRTNAYTKMPRGEQDQLQEAASATIGSMKSMIEEKNRTIEKYRRKLEELQAAHRPQSLADRRADDLLRRLEGYDDQQQSGTSTKGNPNSDETVMRKRLLEQIEKADELLSEKDKVIGQLEQKLAAQINQRERAEERCGMAIKEMEAMKADLITLAEQYHASEEKIAQLQAHRHRQSVVPPAPAPPAFEDSTTAPSQGGPDPGVVRQLQAALKARDTKIKGYREIIVRLKEEFIKSEKDHAVSVAKQKDDLKESRSLVNDDVLGQLQSQIQALKSGLKQAKEELENARKVRDKITQARQNAIEEAQRLERQIATVEAQAASSQEALQKCRRELEESRRRELRIREKLKEVTGDGDDNDGGSGRWKERAEVAEREVAVLRAQNLALRRGDNKLLQDMEVIKHEKAAVGGVEERELDTIRQQLHVKWENEKKLQKRITLLEKRIQEKTQECDDLMAQLRKLREKEDRDKVSATNREKEKEKRDKIKDNLNTVKSDTNDKERLVVDVLQMNELRRRISSLEGENEALRRRAEVEMTNELNAVRHQLNSTRTQLEKLQKSVRGDTKDDEDDNGVTTVSRLRKELEVTVKSKLLLEGQLLDRDARAMEARFEIEARESEAVRLRRRVGELEEVVETLTKSGISANRAVAMAWDDKEKDRPAGGRFQRERDLEGVVEALRKVGDKLRAENERLRKGGAGEERRVIEAEKRYVAERKRSEKLQEDLTALQKKLESFEESDQKLVQRQQLVAQLRRQLRNRDDELIVAVKRTEEAEAKLANEAKKISTYEARIQTLESQVSSRLAVQQRTAVGDRDELQRAKEEISTLRSQLQQLLREKQRWEATAQSALATTSKTEESSRDSNKNLRDIQNRFEEESARFKLEISRLKEENAKLKTELSAFDLEFFEEIENLKYAHAEAIRKLQEYERRYR